MSKSVSLHHKIASLNRICRITLIWAENMRHRTKFFSVLLKLRHWTNYKKVISMGAELLIMDTKVPVVKNFKVTTTFRLHLQEFILFHNNLISQPQILDQCNNPMKFWHRFKVIRSPSHFIHNYLLFQIQHKVNHFTINQLISISMPPFIHLRKQARGSALLTQRNTKVSIAVLQRIKIIQHIFNKLYHQRIKRLSNKLSCKDIHGCGHLSQQCQSTKIKSTLIPMLWYK